MPQCNKALRAIAREVNENPQAFRDWIDGGWYRSLSRGGPLAGLEDLPDSDWQTLLDELRALPRSVLPVLIDAIDLAVQFGKTVEFEAPTVEKGREAEFQREKKVRIEIEYGSEKVSVKLYHLGPEHQAEWYRPSGSQSPAFSYMFR